MQEGLLFLKVTMEELLLIITLVVEVEQLLLEEVILQVQEVLVEQERQMLLQELQ
tara:strand:+ start:111 stop:275 length:165 start_codon:yes stop_codon:yes gene_type:complete